MQSLDLIQTKKRSASHGSLHSSYRAHASRSVASSPARSLRRPLRSVNENTTLLPSPGPLESMLKTTTETGDIGFFSIKSIPHSSTFQHAPRSRLGGREASLLGPPNLQKVQEARIRDDRKRLPSYRDTTSEIISMYGSDSHQSYGSSLSPPLDDGGQRSYSLTTCGSRHVPIHQSSGATQSHSIGGFLQRPRSPFPYPTRLKRPGVRASSPALTENGGVDYSRMVEIDRISHVSGPRFSEGNESNSLTCTKRTVHGSYKPACTSAQPRRPPRLSARPDGHSSTPSLLCHASSVDYHEATVHGRSHRVERTQAWAERHIDRPRRSSDQSVRSCSLSSIVDMYHRPPSSTRDVPPLRSVGSFYYDYTEEFDNIPSKQTTNTLTVAPVPKRAPSLHRPLVLREESMTRLGAESPHQISDGNANPNGGAVDKYDVLQCPMSDDTVVAEPSGRATSKCATEFLPFKADQPSRRAEQGSEDIAGECGKLDHLAY